MFLKNHLRKNLFFVAYVSRAITVDLHKTCEELSSQRNLSYEYQEVEFKSM